MENSGIKKGFDLVVSHRDPKSGIVTKKNPYTLHVISAGDGGKTRLWERPVGSGNLWNLSGEPVGRMEKGEYRKDAPHLEFTPPDTEDTRTARIITEKDSRIAQLERELAAVKAEEKKVNSKLASEKK